MEVKCSVENCIAVVGSRTPKESDQKGRKEVYLQLKDPDGEQLAELKVPWPENEPQPSNIKFVETEECVKLTNEITYATVPLRISKLREVVRSRHVKNLPKRFSSFADSSPKNSSNHEALHDALKDFVNSPLSDGTWKKAFKCLSAKGADADGLLNNEEQMLLINYLPTQSFTPKELKNICEVLRRTNIFGPRSLGPFYELCLSMNQTALLRSVIESSEALSEQSLAIFLDHVAQLASEEDSAKEGEQLLVKLLHRHFGPRRLSECAAQKITTQHASTLLQRCMRIYILPEHSEVAEQALSLLSVLTDTFGNRLIWENDLHDVVQETLEFSERMAEIITTFKQIELKRSQTARVEEDDPNTLYTVEVISLPRRPLNW